MENTLCINFDKLIIIPFYEVNYVAQKGIIGCVCSYVHVLS